MNAPLKIAIIAPSTLPLPATQGGAIETLIDDFLSVNETERGALIHVFAYHDDKAAELSKGYEMATFHYVHPNLFARIRDFLAKTAFKLSRFRLPRRTSVVALFNRIAKHESFDAVLVEGDYTQLPALRPHGSPLLIHFHAEQKLLGRHGGNRVLRHAKKVIGISEYLNGTYAQFAEPGSLCVVKNCIDESLFSGKGAWAGQRKEFRASHGIGEEELCFLFCGRIDPTKGIGEVVCAFKKVDFHKPVRLIVAGAPWFGKKASSAFFDEIKREAGSDPRIQFLGYVPHKELNAVYAACDIFVAPSTCNEAAGLVLVEAMAMGLPVITTERGGIPEYVADGVSITVFADCLEGDLVSAFSEAERDAESLTERAEEAAPSVRVKCSKKRYYSDLMEVVEHV